MPKNSTDSPPAWPADAVHRVVVAALVPYARNARTHSPEQVDQIAASIREWGWTMPVLVDEAGTLIAGHGRLLAAHKLGLETVPAMTAAGWSEAKRRAYAIADNRLALNAGWDESLLALELSALDAEGFDPGLLGFDTAEMDALLNGTDQGIGQSGAGSLADRFGVPPFSVLNAREGWWQDRKRAWLALGIQSEIGRGGIVAYPTNEAANLKAGTYETRGQAAPGGSARPACDYSKRQRGDGAGRPIASNET
jgi:hypothetical protein